jgi:hypothetical protein
MEGIYDWAKLIDSRLHQRIINDWEELLNNDKLKERDYHAFLALSPGLFLTGRRSHLVISKLKLGSDYETDFVVVNEGYSNGTMYNLIEIESPHTKLFDLSGKPTAKLNAALQQIRDWRRFLIDNRIFMKKAFPTVTTRVIKNSKLTFTIVIGRRTDNLEHLEKREQIAEQENVNIISYDRLTDYAKRLHCSIYPNVNSCELDHMSFSMQNELANPFFKCLSDSIWKSINREAHFHVYSHILNILKHRRYNKYYDTFKSIVDNEF